jgi:hypothetical protein
METCSLLLWNNIRPPAYQKSAGREWRIPCPCPAGLSVAATSTFVWLPFCPVKNTSHYLKRHVTSTLSRNINDEGKSRNNDMPVLEDLSTIYRH